MQTFLPYEDFQQTVKCLDYRRLGKQRVETFQVLNILLDRTESKGWRNHPVKRMWTGYEEALKLYQNYTIQEWINRGYNNNMSFETVDLNNIVMPPWMGDPMLHKSHRLKLAWKQWDWYCDKFDDVISQPHDEPEYIWPV
jgi:hypothetical protein